MLTSYSSFLKSMNAEYFAPRGLFAMVMNFRPDETSQVYPVDTSQWSACLPNIATQHRPVYKMQLTEVASLVEKPEAIPNYQRPGVMGRTDSFITDHEAQHQLHVLEASPYV